MDARNNIMITNYFPKRIFTYRTFVQGIDALLANIPDIKQAVRSGRISKPFSERIMLAVTQVNGCRYCHWGHSAAALKTGVTQNQIDAIVGGDLGTLPEEEVPALLFAQHYAESAGDFDEVAWERIVEIYGDDSARDILAYIKMITFGNLWGNTFDALLSRFFGKPARESSIWSELGIMVASFSVLPLKVLLYLPKLYKF